MKRGESITKQSAIALAQKTNKLRAEYYNFYTDKIWGSASSYHLCIDSSLMSMDALADTIVNYIRQRFPSE